MARTWTFLGLPLPHPLPTPGDRRPLAPQRVDMAHTPVAQCQRQDKPRNGITETESSCPSKEGCHRRYPTGFPSGSPEVSPSGGSSWLSAPRYRPCWLGFTCTHNRPSGLPDVMGFQDRSQCPGGHQPFLHLTAVSHGPPPARKQKVQPPCATVDLLLSSFKVF